MWYLLLMSTIPHNGCSLSDSCEPCPRNGECNQGKLECAHGYRKHRNTCIEDGDVYERAKKLVCSENLIHSSVMIFWPRKKQSF